MRTLVSDLALTELLWQAPGEIDSLFRLVDRDSSGKISYAEFASVLKDPDMQTQDVISGDYKGPGGGMAEAVRKDQLRAQGALDDYEGAMKGVSKDHGKMEFFKQKGGKIA